MIDSENKALTDVGIENKKTEEYLKNLTPEQWLWTLNYYGEAQLSMSLYGTINNYYYELVDHLQKKIKTSSKFTNEQESSIIKFKKGFDGNREVFYGEVTNKLGLSGISVWSPVLKYLIKQVPDAYIFSRNSLFPEYVTIDVRYGEKNDVTKELYLACCVENSQKLFKNTKDLEENKDKKIAELQKKLIYVSLASIVVYIISFFLSRLAGGIVFGLFIGFIFSMFYFKSRIVKSNLTRKRIFETLFPNKIIETKLIEYDKLSVRVDLFEKESSGIQKFQEYSNDYDLKPSYVQSAKCVDLSIRSGLSFHPIIGKEEKHDPIILFEKKDVIVIPFEGLNNHPIFQYIIENINIGDLDIPKIISDSLLEETDDQKSL